MSVKVTDYTPKVKAEITQKSSLFLRLVADGIVTTAEPKTPKKDGYLRRSVIRQVLGTRGKVRWIKSYAAVQERGYISGRKIVNYTTPGTGPKYAYNAVKKTAEQTGTYLRRAGLKK